MLKKITIIALLGLALTACASDKPHVIQASSDISEIRLTGGMATQIEMPNSRRVQSVAVGNPDLVTAEKADNVVNLMAKQGSGETNLIVRAVDEDGEVKVYQYRLVVQER